MELSRVDAHGGEGLTRAQTPVPASAPSAMRGGAQLFAAAFVAIAANYLFLLGAGRLLGSSDYSTLAALVGLLTVVLLPSGALQMAVSREVSRREALGEDNAAKSFVSALLVLGTKLTVPLLVVAAALTVPLRDVLNIHETAPVAIAIVGMAGAFVFPIALGALQGQQRFRTLAYVSTIPMLVRLAFLVILALAGLKLYGALVAVSLSALIGVGIAVWSIRDRVSIRVSGDDLKPFLRYLWPVAVGLFGISILTNGDILVVKARFSADDAGIYAAASAFARVAFFLPSTILAVLFPRTAAREARGETTSDILGRSLLVTAAFCAVLTAGYALVGSTLVRTTYGSDFTRAADLLVPFCAAMTLFSLINVLVGYHLSRGEGRFAWVVAAGVVIQVGLLATVPTSLRGVLWVDTAVAGGLLLTHEVVMGSSVPSLRAGLGRFAVAEWPGRAISAVAGIKALLVEAGVVLLVFTGLALAITWPLVLHLDSWQFGQFPNDGTGGVAWLWELRHEGGYHFLGTTHHVLTGAPLGWSQGNALNFQWLWPYYPTYLLAGVIGELAAFNICMIAGFALSGASMYVLVRWLGCGRMVAAWAGLVYVIFPWHLQRSLLGVGSLVHIEIFPLVLMAAIAWIRKPTNRQAFLVAATVTCAWLTSGYFGTIALVTVAAVALAGFWGIRSRIGVFNALRAGLGLMGIVLVSSGAFAMIAILAGGTTGLTLGRSAGEITYWGAHLRDYLPPPVNSVVGSFARDHIDPRLSATSYPGSEGPMYPGVLTALLAVGWLVALLRRPVGSQAVRAASWLLAVVAGASVLLAAPNPMTVFGVRIHPMPSLWLIKVVPSFRVPTRFGVLLVAALAPLAALGLARMCGAVAGRMPTRLAPFGAAAIVLAASAVSAFELLFVPLPMSNAAVAPAAYGALSKTPSGVLAEYPLETNMSPHSENSAYLVSQKIHRRPLLNGAGRSTPADAVRRMLVDPAAPGTAPTLALLGVTAIITRPTTYDWDQSSNLPDKRSYGSGYTLVGAFPGDVRVWRVTARPGPLVAAYRTGDVDEPLAPASDGFIGYPLATRSVRVDLYARHAVDVRLRLDIRSAGARLRRVDVSGAADKRVSVPVTEDGRLDVHLVVSRGASVVTITLPADTTPPPGSRNILFSTITATRAQADEASPLVRAYLLSRTSAF